MSSCISKTDLSSSGSCLAHHGQFPDLVKLLRALYEKGIKAGIGDMGANTFGLLTDAEASQMTSTLTIYRSPEYACNFWINPSQSYENFAHTIEVGMAILEARDNGCLGTESYRVLGSYPPKNMVVIAYQGEKYVVTSSESYYDIDTHTLQLAVIDKAIRRHFGTDEMQSQLPQMFPTIIFDGEKLVYREPKIDIDHPNFSEEAFMFTKSVDQFVEAIASREKCSARVETNAQLENEVKIKATINHFECDFTYRLSNYVNNLDKLGRDIELDFAATKAVESSGAYDIERTECGTMLTITVPDRRKFNVQIDELYNFDTHQFAVGILQIMFKKDPQAPIRSEVVYIQGHMIADFHTYSHLLELMASPSAVVASGQQTPVSVESCLGDMELDPKILASLRHKYPGQ
jgi:hypothetical protein